jgi:hypothetical protein
MVVGSTAVMRDEKMVEELKPFYTCEQLLCGLMCQDDRMYDFTANMCPYGRRKLGSKALGS